MQRGLPGAVRAEQAEDVAALDASARRATRRGGGRSDARRRSSSTRSKSTVTVGHVRRHAQAPARAVGSGLDVVAVERAVDVLERAEQLFAARRIPRARRSRPRR